MMFLLLFFFVLLGQFEFGVEPKLRKYYYCIPLFFALVPILGVSPHFFLPPWSASSSSSPPPHLKRRSIIMEGDNIISTPDNISHSSDGNMIEGGSDLPFISKQLSQIQRLQEEALLQKDRELDQLRTQLELKDREISTKETEIRNLERERLRQQEERALELASLARRGGGGASHHLLLNNPYQTRGGGGWLGFQRLSQFFSNGGFRSARLSDLIHLLLLILLLFQFYHMRRIPGQQSYSDLNHSHQQSPSLSNNNVYDYEPYQPEPEPLKPWESTPPAPISLMSVSDPFIQSRHSCIRAVRDKQLEIFRGVFGSLDKLQVLLVDPAYHSNVGDHMLSLGELNLIQEGLQQAAPKQCHYIQAGGFYDVCTEVIRASDPGASKVALWHAGGNWGDLWRDAQDIRIPSIKTILENGYELVGMPQSLFYRDEELKSKDVVSIKEKVALGLGLASVEASWRRRLEEFGWDENEDLWGDKPAKPVNTSALDSNHGLELARAKVTFMWREEASWEEGSKLYPFVTNVLVPDMAFQLGPYSPIRINPEKLVDVLLLLREDHESKVNVERNEDSIRRILPSGGMTFRIVDWQDRLEIFDTKDYFFTESAIELLSLGKIVVCDRLHAALLSYLCGIPFVYIDQVSGKITKTLSAAFEKIDGCMDGERGRWARASNLQEALQLASDMIAKHSLTHDIGSNHGKGFLRGLFFS